VAQVLNRSLIRRQLAVSLPTAADMDTIPLQRRRNRLSNWLQRRYAAAISH
jgi:hypothetical protein